MCKKLTAAVLALLLGGCASAPNDPNNDPFESTNRAIFALDIKIDHMMLRRTAVAYNALVPEGARDGVHNFLGNLNEPVVFANDVLQGEGARAGQSAERFFVNSTLGLGGFLDIASDMGVSPQSEDFGQTLGTWGVGEGPYLVLPFLGPDPPRDAFGQVVDIGLDPTTYVPVKQHIWWMLGRKYVTILDARARNLDTLDDIERSSLDYYATTRSLYRQFRDNEIRNGRPPPAPPDD